MNRCTPEAVGISSAAVLKFYQKLEERGLSTHAIIMARGNNIFTEAYYAPFNKDFKHRMYSVSKSFVSIAIGFCEQDGLLSLDDPFIKYFPECVKASDSDKASSATIRELLRMQTGLVDVNGWFTLVKETQSRSALYLERNLQEKYPDTLFDYDSFGSYMLGAIVEKVTGKPFLQYLKDKALRYIGFSEDSYCLSTPEGYSWADSAIMCTAYDLLLFARFVLNGGSWDGKQLLNKSYVTEATKTDVCNNYYGFESAMGWGYGYQFWGLGHGCYAMLGMGNQMAICDPTHDLVFVINSDNQGNDVGYAPIVYAFFDFIFDSFRDSALPENSDAYEELNRYTSSRKLFVLPGRKETPFSENIKDKIYYAEDNPMGIKWFKLSFESNEGVFTYENSQGIKELRFGFGHNLFQKFPQTGYSDMIGGYSEPGNTYECAVSADWPEERKLRVRVQIIDKYFANLAIVFGFRNERCVSVYMKKSAEYFLDEYDGILNAKCDMAPKK